MLKTRRRDRKRSCCKRGNQRWSYAVLSPWSLKKANASSKTKTTCSWCSQIWEAGPLKTTQPLRAIQLMVPPPSTTTSSGCLRRAKRANLGKRRITCRPKMRSALLNRNWLLNGLSLSASRLKSKNALGKVEWNTVLLVLKSTIAPQLANGQKVETPSIAPCSCTWTRSRSKSEKLPNNLRAAKAVCHNLPQNLSKLYNRQK